MNVHPRFDSVASPRQTLPQVTPTVIKYVTQVHYEIIQGKVAKLRIALPASHALTRLAGEQIRDWKIEPPAGEAGARGKMQLLELQFIRPLEKQYELTIFSEQTVEAIPGAALLETPQPLEIERESGSLTLSAEDTLAEVESAAGLRQINAPAGALAAYRFNGRPVAIGLKLHRIEPVISVAERVSARMEETRVLSSHSLTLNVEKAVVYMLELFPPSGFLVADVRSEGLEDWKFTDTGATGKVLRKFLQPGAGAAQAPTGIGTAAQNLSRSNPASLSSHRQRGQGEFGSRGGLSAGHPHQNGRAGRIARGAGARPAKSRHDERRDG